jgi:hypothetical protein
MDGCDTSNLEATRLALLWLEIFLSSAGELTINAAIAWLTINPTVRCPTCEAMCMKPFSNTYFDSSNFTHDKLDIDPEAQGTAKTIVRFRTRQREWEAYDKNKFSNN